MAFAGKKGDTLVNFAFIIGMLLIAVAVTITLTRFSLFQARQLETDALLDFSQNIKNTLEKAQSSPNDANFQIKLTYPLLYTLSVDKGRINLDFPQYTYKTQTLFFSSNTNIIGKKIENSGEILIIKRENTILITDEVSCDTTDEVCDPGCIIQQKCDPACYKDYLQDVCNPYCVDKNPDGIINEKDLDGICDPDCYGEDIRGTYDPDCLFKNDNICDPNTDSNPDNFCDTYCLNTNGVCDPDCSQYDADCPHQDNGVCEVKRGEKCSNDADCACDAITQVCKGICPQITIQPDGCINISDMKQEGIACTQQCQCAPGLVCDTFFGTNTCCPAGEYFDGSSCVPNIGDLICNAKPTSGENCGNSTDCSCTGGKGCCPDSPRKDAQGCVLATGIEGDACVCDTECVSPLLCGGGACCPSGEEWDGDSCEVKYTYTILLIQLNGAVPNLQTAAENAKNIWTSISPLKQCPERVRAIAVTDKICNAPECDALDSLISCANSWGYGNEYTRIIGVLPPSKSFVCQPGIRGYTQIYFPAVVSIYSSLSFTGSHEMGHTFGLCDEGYGLSPVSTSTCASGYVSCGGTKCSCPVGSYCCPDSPEPNSLMCSANICGTACSSGQQFAPTSYAHLEKELLQYCQ
ncbi:MAG: hypothetical protein AABX51_07055 [Nanoarchaeota archaeon]